MITIRILRSDTMWSLIKQYGVITIGFVIVALSLHFFLIPNDIAAGGATGLAMVINHYIPVFHLGPLMVILNVLLFIIAFLVMGSRFGVKTIYASLGLSGTIWIFEHIIPVHSVLSNDLLLSTIMGTLGSGIGMAVIFNENASTGGTDIIAKIIHKYMHIDIGRSLLITDFTITLLAAFAFGVQKALYALLAVIANGYIIDYAIEGFNVAMEVFIMTSKPDTISEYVINELDRGVTHFLGQGGYSKKEYKVIYTVISRKEFIKLRGFIKEVDPKAFITVSDAHEVLGEGFKGLDSD